jgi:hypothetical protein
MQDPARESGVAGKLWARKRQGIWRGFGGAEVYSDGFDPNDLGQLHSSNAYVLIGSVEHDLNGNRPFGPFQRANAEIFGVQRYAYRDGLDQGLSLELSSRWVLRGFQQIEASVGLENPFGGYDLYETRGLGPWAPPSSVELELEFNTDERRNWRLGPEVSLALDDAGGREYGAELRGEWDVSDRLALEASLEGRWEDDVLAWSSNETFLLGDGGWMIRREAGRPGDDAPEDYVAFDDGGALTAILGGVPGGGPGRYFVPVFGARDTRSVDTTLRSTYTFTPHLSFQLYGQLFLAGGRYDRMGILRGRDDLAGFDAFPKRDDFAFGTLQSNAVLRWEYRPGSALYVVWTHGRSERDELNPLGPWGGSPYERSIGRQLGDTFDVFPNNVFQVKLSYTFLN